MKEYIPQDQEKRSRDNSTERNLIGMYFKEMGKMPLLDTAGEKELGQKLEDNHRELFRIIYAANEGSYCGKDVLLQEVEQYPEPNQKQAIRELKEVIIGHLHNEEPDKAFASMFYSTSFRRDLIRDIAGRLHDYLVENTNGEYTQTKGDLLRNMRQAERIQERLATANLRLVISVARKYQGRGLEFSDLIQEGNLGLLKAADNFDFRLGYKFSTYAVWWIRQGIERAIMNQARDVRLPVNVLDVWREYVKTEKEMSYLLGREVSEEEICKELGIERKLISHIKRSMQPIIQLDAPVGADEGKTAADYISDDVFPTPSTISEQNNLHERVNRELNKLPPDLQEIIKRRFGFDLRDEETLEQISKDYSITREAVRLRQKKGMKQLQERLQSLADE